MRFFSLKQCPREISNVFSLWKESLYNRYIIFKYLDFSKTQC